MRTIGSLWITREELGVEGAGGWKAQWSDVVSVAYTGGAYNEVAIEVSGSPNQTHQVVLGVSGGLEQLVDLFVARKAGHVDNPIAWDFTFTPHG